jgi:hypothetical protein
VEIIGMMNETKYCFIEPTNKMLKELMLADTNLPFMSMISQFFDILDQMGKQGFGSITFHYSSTISQTSPSSILDWILTFADIAGVAAIGLVVAVVYFQSRQRKFAGLIEIFKLLNGKEQREARAMLFEHFESIRKQEMIPFLMMNFIKSM